VPSVWVAAIRSPEGGCRAKQGLPYEDRQGPEVDAKHAGVDFDARSFKDYDIAVPDVRRG
jgi:hypothetical protein